MTVMPDTLEPIRFALMTEAPDAIPRFRRFVLDLAVRGKLVPQDPDDESMDDCKNSLKDGLSVSTKTLTGNDNSDLTPPFSFPGSWQAARVREVLVTRQGTQIEKAKQISKLQPGYKRYLYISDFKHDQNLKYVRDEYPTKEVTENDLVMANTAGPGVVFKGVPGILSNNLFKISFSHEQFCQEFLFIYFTSPSFVNVVSAELKGGAQQHLGHKLMGKQFVPIPPLAEQHRIVVKVDELMVLCDELEAAQQKRESRRDRLVTAALRALTSTDSPATSPASKSSFIPNSRFLIRNFTAVTTKPEHIKQLRQTILDLAVRGKLVPQEPDDEPAEELLKRIETEKARLVKEGKIKKKRSQDSLNEENVPFNIPDVWAWSCLDKIGLVSPRNAEEDTSPTSFIPMPLIPAEYGWQSTHEVRAWGEIKSGYTHFAEGDVALAKITPCFENGKSTVFRDLTGGIGAGTTELHVVRPIFISPEYILVFLKSAHFIQSGIPIMTGTAGQKRVPKDYFSFSPFPLPPLAEQQRIVAKVNELMVLCDELETQLTATASTQGKFLEATLQKALEV